MWWNTNRPPTVVVGPLLGISLTSLTSTADTYRSSPRPVGTCPIGPQRSGATDGTITSGDRSTRSGSPIVHLPALAKSSGGGMSAGLPRGAPLSAHFAILAISSSLREGSFLNFWIPMFFSMNHGGIAPRLVPSPVRVFMARAYGLASSYVRSDIGATESGRWQFWQLRCRMGAMSFANVTSPVVVAGA